MTPRSPWAAPAGSSNPTPGAQSDFDRDRFAYSAAKAGFAKAKADLNRIKVTWDQDQRVSAAAVEQAQAMLESTRIEIDRLTVRAQADGKVLQVNVRPGQFAAVVWKEPLIVLGDVDKLPRPRRYRRARFAPLPARRPRHRDAQGDAAGGSSTSISSRSSLM